MKFGDFGYQDNFLSLADALNYTKDVYVFHAVLGMFSW